MPEAVTLTDPVLSASIYAGGLLDDLLVEVITPFWRDARIALGEKFALWLVRYSRGGEHLKVRIHAAPGDRPWIRKMLTDRVGGYFNKLQHVPRLSQQESYRNLPPIDPEDAAPLAPQDRSLQWTTYRRSPITMATPWLMFDEFAEQSYQCMARGCDWTLAVHKAGWGQIRSARNRLLIHALLLGLPTLGIDTADYLRYHRDWLLRFLIPDSDGQRAALEQMSSEIRKRNTTVKQIRRLNTREIASQKISSDYGIPFARALSNLADYIESIRHSVNCEADPYASHIVFPPVFKIMHNLANQSGIRPLEEAFLYHLVLAAHAPAAAEPEHLTVASGVAS